ncbi:hypothetical protein BLOT_007181 [Blomia tropicalis]|nr:hypothetical protein BLOT_007181 [Blomia tropicalis]
MHMITLRILYNQKTRVFAPVQRTILAKLRFSLLDSKHLATFSYECIMFDIDSISKEIEMNI